VRLFFATIAVAFGAPTLPFPRFNEKASKFALFPFPRLTFVAAIFSKLSKLKKCCSAPCAVTALSRFSCCRIKRTATRAKSRTSSVTRKSVVGTTVTEVVVVVGEMPAVGIVVVGTTVTEVVVVVGIVVEGVVLLRELE
jgi:hypothetical protein